MADSFQEYFFANLQMSEQIFMDSLIMMANLGNKRSHQLIIDLNFLKHMGIKLDIARGRLKFPPNFPVHAEPCGDIVTLHIQLAVKSPNPRSQADLEKMDRL
ncbi:hypothetical protein F4861DRAFT_543999 [Xylaria intraflava]|nr:hypothetical protein F4861DRAFT_543999 [Xylaria intraflava]